MPQLKKMIMIIFYYQIEIFKTFWLFTFDLYRNMFITANLCNLGSVSLKKPHLIANLRFSVAVVWTIVLTTYTPTLHILYLHIYYILLHTILWSRKVNLHVHIWSEKLTRQLTSSCKQNFTKAFSPYMVRMLFVGS